MLTYGIPSEFRGGVHLLYTEVMTSSFFPPVKAFLKWGHKVYPTHEGLDFSPIPCLYSSVFSNPSVFVSNVQSRDRVYQANNGPILIEVMFGALEHPEHGHT